MDRREFLKRSLAAGIGGAALLLPGRVSSRKPESCRGSRRFAEENRGRCSTAASPPSEEWSVS